MCLIVFAWNQHPEFPLILAANRDEFYDRPTAPADFWEDHPALLGGRDLKAAGTWMAVTRAGKFAAVTNYRDLANIQPDAISRGGLASEFLLGDQTPKTYIRDLVPKSSAYNGFNLLVSDLNEMIHFSNYQHQMNAVESGIYGLSNALLDTPWPKVNWAKERFNQLIQDKFDHDDLIHMMSDTQQAAIQDLPNTGVSVDMEQALSSLCIRMDNYGTCCSTVITIDRHGVVQFTEKSYPVGDRKDETLRYDFKIDRK